MQKLYHRKARARIAAGEICVIYACASQYKNDKAVESLVKECDKYEEQPS